MLSIDRFREVDPKQDHYKYWTEPIQKRPSTRFRGAKEGYRLSKINKLLREARAKNRTQKIRAKDPFVAMSRDSFLFRMNKKPSRGLS